MSFLTKILSIFDPGSYRFRGPFSKPAARAVPVPDGKLRLHIFAGTFETSVAAHTYCFATPDSNHPEPLTRDLPGAFVDTQHVEVTFGNIRERLDAFLDGTTAIALLNQIGEHNTLVIITDAAFGGFPYTLNDTPMLNYIGPQIVDI